MNQNGIQTGERESFYHRKRGIAFIRENGANTEMVRRWYGEGTAKVRFFQGENGGVRIDILIKCAISEIPEIPHIPKSEKSEKPEGFCEVGQQGAGKASQEASELHGVGIFIRKILGEKSPLFRGGQKVAKLSCQTITTQPKPILGLFDEYRQ